MRLTAFPTSNIAIHPSISTFHKPIRDYERVKVNFMSKTMEAIQSAILANSASKRDITVPAKSIILNQDATWNVGAEQMKATRWANSQIFNRLGMPAKYFNELLETDPELAAYHTNRVIKQDDSEWFIRTKIGNITLDGDEDTSEDAGESPYIRGVMSDKYSVLDNDKVMEALTKIINHYTSDYEINAYNLLDHRMHVRITLPQTAKQFGTTTRAKGDILQVGLDIVNSEVGYTAMNIMGFVWRLVCTNGMRRMERGDMFSQRHIYIDDAAFFNRCCQAITDGVQNGQKTMEQFAALKALPLTNTLPVHDVIGTEFDLSKSIVESAKELWENDDSAYGVINSFTAAARGLDDEKRLEIEREAGKMLMIPAKTWKKYDLIASDID